jgi:type IV pilus assembly protein PilV
MAVVFERACFRHRRVARAQCGAFLLEALVALLIFSFGVMAIAGLQARAARHFNEAQYRANAAELVQATIASMRASDPATLAARFDPATGTADWLALLGQAKRLPGVNGVQNVPAIQISDGPTTTSRQVSLSVFWQTPGDPRAHRYVASAVIATN